MGDSTALQQHVWRLWGKFLTGHVGEFELWLELFEQEVNELAKQQGRPVMEVMEELEDSIGRSLSLSVTFTSGEYQAVRRRLNLPVDHRPTTEELEEYVREAVERTVAEDEG